MNGFQEYSRPTEADQRGEMQIETLVIDNPQTLKAVNDPLRKSILEKFDSPRTTKQVAGLLGIMSNKLYHHVDILAKAKLISLVEVRSKRGTTEKYFQAVAKNFVVSPNVLAAGSGLNPDITEVASIMEQVSDETTPADTVVFKAHFNINPDDVERVQEKLLEFAKQFSSNEPESQNYNFVAVAYPAAV